MRLVLTTATVAIAVGAGFAVIVPASTALAQAMGMDCFGNRGGRAMCVESSHSIIDRLDEKARERQANARDSKLIRRVAEAVHAGRCSDALALAVKARNPNIAANTARLCGVPEVENDKTTPLS